MGTRIQYSRRVGIPVDKLCSPSARPKANNGVALSRRRAVTVTDYRACCGQFFFFRHSFLLNTDCEVCLHSYTNTYTHSHTHDSVCFYFHIFNEYAYKSILCTAVVSCISLLLHVAAAEEKSHDKSVSLQFTFKACITRDQKTIYTHHTHAARNV